MLYVLHYFQTLKIPWKHQNEGCDWISIILTVYFCTVPESKCPHQCDSYLLVGGL